MSSALYNLIYFLASPAQAQPPQDHTRLFAEVAAFFQPLGLLVESVDVPGMLSRRALPFQTAAAQAGELPKVGQLVPPAAVCVPLLVPVGGKLLRHGGVEGGLHLFGGHIAPLTAMGTMSVQGRKLRPCICSS